MQSGYIDFKSSSIHYTGWGNGPSVLLCLHGYGESEKSFHFLEKYLAGDYRVIAIDLPFHGKTTWNEPVPVTMEDLLLITAAICKEQGLPVTQLNLLAFSMGGRVALSFLQKQPATVSKIVLLAPDGLKVNFWYWLATQTYIGLKLFRFTMHNPGWFFLLLRAGNFLRLINPGFYKFIRYYIHDKDVRRELFNRWTCLRKIKPALPIIKKYIQQHHIPVRLLYGKYDRIIRYERAEKFRKGIEDYCSLEVIPAGHQLLSEKQVELILNLLHS